MGFDPSIVSESLVHLLLVKLSRSFGSPFVGFVSVMDKSFHSKWFEPRSISSSYSVIVRVSVVLKRTVVGD